MYDEPGWDAHLLNGKMMEMLQTDCGNRSELIETNGFYRWSEEHKQVLSTVSDSITDYTKALIFYNSMVTSQNQVCRRKSLITKGSNYLKKTADKIVNVKNQAVLESGSKTGTVWNNITSTQENYPYTNIPKSFEIDVNGEKMWVHGNATEHMYEDVYKGITTGNGTAYTNPNLYTQEIMSDFYGSLQEVTKSGIVYGEKITQGNWEFIFAQPRQAGQLPVIKHAQFNGWH